MTVSRRAIPESTPNTSIPPGDSDDPWIASYLQLRTTVVSGQVGTPDEIADYASQLSRDLPAGGPPPSIAAFIAADIKITFPVQGDLLWTPSYPLTVDP